MSNNSDTYDFVYIYRSSNESVSIPAGDTEIRVVWSLDARRRRKPLSLKTFRGGYALTKEIRAGSTFLLLPRSSPKRKPPRREMVFGSEQAGTVTEMQTSQLLSATISLLQQMEEFGDDLAIEYGIFMNVKDPVMRCVSPDLFTTVPTKQDIQIQQPSCWSQFYTGIQFPNDPHPYTVWSSFGVLDRIKHDPNTLVEIERSDIRSCEEVLRPANSGQIRFFQRTHDISPLRAGLTRLRDFLQRTSDDTVDMMSDTPGSLREVSFRQAGT